MKYFLTTILGFVFSATLWAQAPQKIDYQCVLFNSSNQLVVNQTVGMQTSILQGTANGTPVYVETHFPTTDVNGAVSLEIGAGNPVSGNFATINWNNGPYFLKAETDLSGGSNYTITATGQLLSVPYVLYSDNGISGVSTDGDTLQLANGNYILLPDSSHTPMLPHTCGAPNVHNGNLTYGSMTDQDGNVYKTIIIGTQEWMAENLRTSHYSNGDLIPEVTSASAWNNLSTGASCWYLNDSATYSCPYGKLYNWYTANDSRNVCPTGWHVPNSTDNSTLWFFFDINANAAGSSIVGSALKSKGFSHWLMPNRNAENISGFSVLPAGYRNWNGRFSSINERGFIWTTFYNGSYPFAMRFGFHHAQVFGDQTFGNQKGFSIRCVRD